MNHHSHTETETRNRTRPTASHWALMGVVAATLAACGGGDSSTAVVPTPKEQLGKLIFNDTLLSEPKGISCVACHLPDQGLSGTNGGTAGVPVGAGGAQGFRTSMSVAYMGYVPSPGFKDDNGTVRVRGGFRWDGGGDSLGAQSQRPFIVKTALNVGSGDAVVSRIAAGSYASLFKDVFGADAFTPSTTAFDHVSDALAAFQASAELAPFSSKYDAVITGKATFTPAESRGMALFQDPNRANCAGCHTMNPSSGNPKDSLFANFQFYATGVPRNMGILVNADPKFFDLGLCGPNRTVPTIPAAYTARLKPEDLCGQFRITSLRNVAERPSFMHNGVFRTLEEVVHFYSTRNSQPQRWYGPSGVMNDLPTAYLGNVEKTIAPFNRTAAQGDLLTEAEVSDMLAFLHTLSDGHRQP